MNWSNSSYHHIFAARFWVRLTNEPIQTATLDVLQDTASSFQLRLRGMHDSQNEAVSHLGVGNHVIDCVRQLEQLTVQ